MSVPQAIKDFQLQVSPLDKEGRRTLATKVANGLTQKHPLGTSDHNEQLLMRHLFVHLPTEDIAKYMGNFLLGTSNTKQEVKSLWIGEPPMWASTCRMMHAYYNKFAWDAIWNTKISEVGNANAQVIAGMYSVAYDKKYYEGWVEATDGGTSVWLEPSLFADWSKVKDETKLKVWMVVSSKKDPELLQKFAEAMGWSQKWSLADNLLGENLFQPDHTLREIALKQLLFNNDKVEMYALPTMDLN